MCCISNWVELTLGEFNKLLRLWQQRVDVEIANLNPVLKLNADRFALEPTKQLPAPVSVFFVLTSRSDGMSDQWAFKSETCGNCNCAINCGRQFNLPGTYGYCQSAFIGNIVEGHFNDTPLAGLNWAALYKIQTLQPAKPHRNFSTSRCAWRYQTS